MPKPLVHILMATYNGEKYIKQQIDSIIAQSHQEFVLYINDDNSSDATFDIASEYAQKEPNKIIVTRNKVNSGSAKRNFFGMLATHKHDYLMLCDQDDVWLPDKISKTMIKMKELENLHGVNMPILVHTDLCVVNQDLQLINSSHKQAMGLDFTRIALQQVLIQNVVTGNTVMYNRSLSELIGCEPEYFIMHDWWLKLIASSFGKIGSLGESQTVLYRQHGKNEVGAKDIHKLSYKVNRLIKGGSIKEAIRTTCPQASCFLEIYKCKLAAEQIALIENYCIIPKLGKLSRWRTLSSMGALKSGVIRNIAYLIFI